MTAFEHSVARARMAAIAAEEVKAENIVAIDVSERLYLTEVFVIASAASERQVQAIADKIEEGMLRIGAKPSGREGAQLGRWILLDFGDVVVHVMHNEDRAYYALERLWKDCPTISLGIEEPNVALVTSGSVDVR